MNSNGGASDAVFSKEDRDHEKSSRSPALGDSPRNDWRTVVAEMPSDGNGTKKRSSPSQGSDPSDLSNEHARTSPESSKADDNESSTSQSKCSSVSASVSSQNEDREKSRKRSKGSKPKKDRSKLRKGKWTVRGTSLYMRVCLSPDCLQILYSNFRWKKKSIRLELFATSALVYLHCQKALHFDLISRANLTAIR